MCIQVTLHARMAKHTESCRNGNRDKDMFLSTDYEHNFAPLVTCQNFGWTEVPTWDIKEETWCIFCASLV